MSSEIDVERLATVLVAHVFTLVFEDGDGDFARCSCRERGWDFKQGREWYAAHLAAEYARLSGEGERA